MKPTQSFACCVDLGRLGSDAVGLVGLPGELDSGPGLEVRHQAGGVGLNGAEFVVEVGST